MTQPLACILGITGGVGGSIGRALLRHGWRLRGLARDPDAARAQWSEDVEWVKGDALDAAAVARAAQGAEAIVHAVSPKGYGDWDRTVLPWIDNTIAAARGAGARIVLPGTVYNYDPLRTPAIDERTPQHAPTHKGALRAELERRLQAASRDVPVLILRAGDFFGPGARSSWFSQALVAPGRRVRRIVNPGKGVGHSWAYMPDLAEAFARLLEAPERLRTFETVQFAGVWDPDGRAMPEAIRRALGRDVPEYRFPWWLMRALAPFGGFPRAVREIELYWRHPLRLDNARLVELIGAEPHTPLDMAIATALREQGST